MQLRPYQLEAVAQLRRYHSERPLLCVPTGGGKTSIAAEIIRSATAKGHRSIFLVHRRELLDQALTRLRLVGIECGAVLAGIPESRDHPVQVASIPTLIRRDHVPADLVIVDEAAHATSQSWRTVIERYEKSWLIGMTATPCRLDGKPLGEMFGRIVEPVSTAELVRQGFLIEPDVWAPAVDLSGVPVRRGDYDTLRLFEKMDKLTGNIIEHWHKHAAGLRTVVFACNIEHSMEIALRFRQSGVRCMHLDGRLPAEPRARMLAQLADGAIDMISSVSVLTEGWDLPALQCCVLARPTKSLALFRQMIGRVMRPPGPVVVLDHAGNHNEHGDVMRPIEWSLEGRVKSDVDSIHTCPECFRMMEPGATVCPECGAAQISEPSEPEPIEEVNGALQRFKGSSAAERADEYRKMVEEASRNGYKLGHARHRYNAMYGKWPHAPRELERSVYKCPVPGHEWVNGGEWAGMVCGYCRVVKP